MSDNQLYSRRMVWQDESNQYCSNPHNSSPPSTLSTVTRLVNLGHQAAHSPTHQQIHSHRSTVAEHWDRKPWQGLSALVPVKGRPPREKEQNRMKIYMFKPIKNVLHLELTVVGSEITRRINPNYFNAYYVHSSNLLL